MQTFRSNFVWTWWFSFKSKKVCHLYVCILEPQANTPVSEMKVSKSSLMKKKRKITPYDDSWIDSLDPRPMKGRKEINHKENIDFTKKLWKIDPCSGILDFLLFSPNYDENENCSSHFDNNISHLTISSQAKNYVKTNSNKLSEDNLLNLAEEFLKALTFSDNDSMTINEATMGQHENKS